MSPDFCRYFYYLWALEPLFQSNIFTYTMKLKNILCAAVIPFILGCQSENSSCTLPAWNDTPVKARLLEFINKDVDQIPVADRIAVFDMDGTLVCEKPWGIETFVSLHKLAALGETDSVVREWKEYQFAKKLLVNPRDTAVLNHAYENGQNYFANIILKPFDGADKEEYVEFANQCLSTDKHWEHDRAYGDMFYQPMLELIDALKKKQFQIYIVSASMQGIVWSICPQELGLERDHLIGIRHPKQVHFAADGKVSYTIKAGMMSPVNSFEGKTINIYDHIGKLPVMAVGNAYSDFGMFHLTEGSGHPHVALLLHHDDAEREYVYEPTHSVNWQDTLRHYNWLQADMSKEFKEVWKKK